MGEIVVELEESQLDQYSFAETVEQGVCRVFVNGLASELGDMLLEDDFSANAVPERFSSAIDRLAPDALERAKRREARRWPEDGPVTRRLGELAIGHDEPPRFRLNDAFVAGLKHEVTHLGYDFGELAEYRQVWEDTELLDLFRLVHSGARSGEPGWLDRAFAGALHAAQHPEAYALPPDKPESLLLLCYLPYDSRQLLRRLVVGQMLTAGVEQKLGDLATQDTDTAAVLGALKHYLTTDALTGQQWYERAEKYGLDERHAVTMARLSAESLQALSTIQRLTREGRGLAVQAAVVETLDELREATDRADDLTLLSTWQSVDRGHGLDGFRHTTLREAFGLAPYSHEFAAPPKTGGRAVILEDDPQQLELWKRTVDNHTVFTTEEALCFAEPDGVVERADDLSVGLMLLDIQNGSDETAGVRVAEAALHRRLALIAQLGADSTWRFHITVWSASPEAVKAANAYLRNLWDILPSEQAALVDYDFLGSASSASRPILLRVAHKQWAPYGSGIAFHRQ